MTYKVIIVDDEPMIRYGLSSCIQWENEGFELVGEASNGESALQIIQHKQIDILITDIRMPIMDGLELTRQVKIIYPNIKVILVSSYSDFDYAREAVKLGVVVDYLLKPTMEPDDLLRILNVCKTRLDEATTRIQETSIFRNPELENGLKKIIAGETVHLGWIPDWMKKELVVAVWQCESSKPHPNETALESLLQLEKAKHKLLEWCGDGIVLITGKKQLVTVFTHRMGSSSQQIEKFHRRIIDEEGICFSVGISQSIHGMAALTDAYMWASKALDQSFFEGKGKCYYGSIGSRLKSDNADNLHHAWSELRKRFSKGLADENKEDCEVALQQCFTAWEQKNNKSEIITQARSLVTILWSRKNSLKTEEIMTALMDKIQDILHMGTYKELKDYINIEFHRIWEADTILITTVDSGSAHAIQLAMSYIQENYRGELSLQDVADHVHMSRNYFSEQFKRVVGLNFIDFVIRLRIHYAMHLLRQTNIKIYDVGLHAGFNSSKHFLKLFKREVNSTPAEYRQSFGKRSD